MNFQRSLLWSKIQHVFLGLSFYRQYFETVHSLTSGEPRQSLKLALIRALLLFGCFHSICLVFIQPKVSFLVNALVYNLFFLAGFGPGWNLFFAGITLAGQYCYELLYRRNTGLSAAILKDLLLHRKCDFLLWPFRSSIKSIWIRKKTSKMAFKYVPPQSIIQLICLAAALLTKAWLLCLFGELMQLSIAHWNLFNYFLANRQTHSTAFWIIFWVAFEGAATIALIIIHIFMRILLLSYVLGALQLLISYFIFKQLDEYTATISTLSAWWVFLRKTPLYLAYLSDASRVYGTLLFISLLICLPVTAIGAITLLLCRLPLHLKILLLGSGLLIGLIIFAYHFALAYVGMLIDRPAKRIIRLYLTRNGLFRSLRDRLTVIRFIEQFHSLNGHSFTYGRFGKITFASFGKHCFYFLKIASITFKIVQKINSE